MLEENTRLFALLSDYRAAQRQAVALGVGGAVVLSVVLALLLSRTIAKPIEAVSGATSRLARETWKPALRSQAGLLASRYVSSLRISIRWLPLWDNSRGSAGP